MPADAEFLKKLLAAFRVEADEHIQAMSKGLLEIENEPDSPARLAIVETIFREAHSLKGAARAVDLSDIEAICQALENVFAAWKRREISPVPEQFDVLHRAVDTVSSILTAAEPGALAKEVPAIIQQIAAIKSGVPAPAATSASTPVATTVPAPAAVPATAAAIPVPVPLPTQPASESAPPQVERAFLSETIRISTAKLDSLLLEAEDMLSLKQVARQRATELAEAEAEVARWRKTSTKFSSELNAGNGSTTPKIREFLEWNQGCVQSLENRIVSLARLAAQDRRMVGAMVESLLENTKRLVMLPFSTLLEAFPKLVRDLARDEGKQVRLEMSGSDVEIDKRVLEEMKDPLVHLLRNCVDHGIEKPESRMKQGKAERGNIEVAVSQVDGSTVEIRITDDGAGIDPAAVKQAAIKHGVVSADDAAKLSEQDAVSLIFKSDVSTSPIITEVSGRGLGLAIVREKVEKIGGRVSVKTTAGKGTVFRILLPLTLSTFRGILVETAGQTFIVPTSSVETVTRVKPEQIHSVENRETIAIEDQAVSFVRLNDVLELSSKPAASSASGWITVIVLVATQQRVAFGVDRVIDEQEILVKPLGKPLLRVRNIAGATVLGSGKAVPILNAPDLVKAAAWTTRTSAAPPTAAARKKKPVLVVEDSITSRMLLKNILESAGYEVKTAVDGMDAWTTLRTEPFELVVSDVEMPRMTGFDLTARIRADKRLSELPVVLVTAREAREDRERGIDVGANAYVVKSSFDQSNLLEVIGRLI